MIKVREAVIVEGRYDKLKLSNILDALIIETNGFSVFNDTEKMSFMRRLAEERGIIILTDSDSGGFQIRRYIAAGIPRDRVKHIYIPDIYGKERRKKSPSKQGKLGVEGMSEKLLEELFIKAQVEISPQDNTDPVTPYDLYSLGISGVAGAKENKSRLLKALDLPEFLSTNSLLGYINSSMTREDFISLCSSIFPDTDA